jgi:2-C-methyl-D-erythritol 2,4-cyclodiphosphate synthase
MYRIGFGTDFHRLAAGRKLWLGGVNIPHEKGAVGHSDADVLLHAICDALLGSLALGDIGVHFPDTDPSFKDVESRILLERTHELIRAKGYGVVNIDSTVCLERPRIMGHAGRMRELIAEILQITVADISIKATTAEKLGFIGREEGLTASAIVLVKKVE